MKNILAGVPEIVEVLKGYKIIYRSRTLIVYERRDLLNDIPGAPGDNRS